MNRTHKIGMLATVTMACLLLGSASGFVGVAQNASFAYDITVFYSVELDDDTWNATGSARLTVAVAGLSDIENPPVAVGYLRTYTNVVQPSFTAGLDPDILEDITTGGWFKTLVDSSAPETIHVSDGETLSLPADVWPDPFFIGKNVASKSVQNYASGGMSVNATWNANGVLTSYSYMMVEDADEIEQGLILHHGRTLTLVTAGPGDMIDGFTPALLAVAALLVIPVVAARMKRKTRVHA